MANYRGIWETSRVSIELRITGQEVVLERTRGKNGKKKRVILEENSLGDLAQALLVASENGPTHQLTCKIPVGFVDGGFSLLSLDWEPYWHGRKNALIIRGPKGVAIEQEDLKSFACWLLGQWISTGGFDFSELITWQFVEED